MRQFRRVVRSAVPIVSGAFLAVLLVPVTAFAGGFAAPNNVHHAATGSGGPGTAVLIGIVTAAVLFVLTLSRTRTERRSAKRAVSRDRHEPAHVAS